MINRLLNWLKNFFTPQVDVEVEVKNLVVPAKRPAAKKPVAKPTAKKPAPKKPTGSARKPRATKAKK